LFPIFVICGTAASRGKGRRKKWLKLKY
jgi:hypothetical protein